MATLIYSPGYGRYSFGDQHPFSPIRVEMLLDLLSRLGRPMEYTEPEPVTREQLATVHDAAYLDVVEAASRYGAVGDPERWGIGTADTPAFPGMDDVTRLVVGGTVLAAQRVLAGDSRVLQLGGGLHHAHRDHGSGFCVYNDLAVAIKTLTAAGLWVTYLDLDVHHGDGVQAIFYGDERVQTISLHESGQYLFPGTGEIHELGEGTGRGLAVNVPLEPFTDGASYLDVFDAVVPRVLEWFNPGVLVVQAGADAHFDDPLADLALTTRDYEAIYRRVVELAERFTKGRLLVTLGGGYSTWAVPRVWSILVSVLEDFPIAGEIPAGWAEKWAGPLGGREVATLHDPPDAFSPVTFRDRIARQNLAVAERLLDALSRYFF